MKETVDALVAELKVHNAFESADRFSLEPIEDTGIGPIGQGEWR